MKSMKMNVPFSTSGIMAVHNPVDGNRPEHSPSRLCHQRRPSPAASQHVIQEISNTYKRFLKISYIRTIIMFKNVFFKHWT